MKRFKKVSAAFIIAIAVIFCCNVYYLASLYISIRNNVEREVMTALADADLDELWIRADCAQGMTSAQIYEEQENTETKRHGELSAGKDSSGNLVATTRYADGTEETKNLIKEDGQSYNNLFAQAIGRQFHAVIDPYLEVNLTVMDSVLLRRLNDRFIYPEFVSTEIIEGDGKVIVSNPKYKAGNYDEFTYCFNPEANRSYRVYITSLTRHIFSEMAGVIVTVFLLMAAFSLAFGYLFRTVSRLRTIEEMKDDFVNNMTHELKTPISIAYSANDALLHYDTANDPAKKETYLTIANKQLKRLGELVENILAMSMERRKTMQLSPETIHLTPFINEIAAAQRMRGEKEITIDVETSEGTTVYADKTHLANILNNLIDNSIKYSGDIVRITVKCDGNGIAVSDNGIGIPAKSIPFLFNKFYRVPHGNRQDTRGYGIGLYYVKCMTEIMGWAITIKSSEGKGTTFFIDFCKDER